MMITIVGIHLIYMLYFLNTMSRTLLCGSVIISNKVRLPSMDFFTYSKTSREHLQFPALVCRFQLKVLHIFLAFDPYCCPVHDTFYIEDYVPILPMNP